MARVLKKPADFKQGDSRWGSISYAAKGENSTIKTAGCCPTSTADLAYLIDKSITPKTVAAWMLKNGYKCLHSGTYYGAPVAYMKTLGVKVTRLTSNSIYGNPNDSAVTKALDAIDAGHYVIACMGKGTWTKAGHYITVYGYDSSHIYVCDPASSRDERLKGDLATWKKQIKQLYIVEIDGTKTSDKDDKMSLKEASKMLQSCLNMAYKCKLSVDGDAGPKTYAQVKAHNIKKGSNNAYVGFWQKALNELNNAGLKIDSDFGDKTKAATIAFQKKYGLTQDGIVGTNCIKKALALYK